MITRIAGLLRNIGAFSLFLLPWFLRRPLLNLFFGYKIDPSAKIGLSWFFPKHLSMGPGARIGHLNVCKGLDQVDLGEMATIGRLNWISGFPSNNKHHFVSDENRKPQLILCEHAAITNRHIIDCTNSINIGAFSTLAGFRSQFLTHSIDLRDSIQRSRPIFIGRYCFVGTGVIILGGAKLPDKSVLGAGSVLIHEYLEESMLYAGAPAKAIKSLETNCGYFVRTEGFVR